MKKYLSLLFIVLFLFGCQAESADEVVQTPPIVEETQTEESTEVPPTVASEPEAPTAVSTEPPAVEEAPTNTPEPTPEPQPSTQQVTSINLVSILAEGQLFKPVYLTHAFDDRLFIVEQAGSIRIMENGSLLADPFLNIQDRVNSNANEQGLLSVAFHPAYEENGRFYVNYTNSDGSTVVSSFQVQADNPNLADPATEQILFTVAQPYNNHNGGQLAFGPDGYLYIGMGDGGSAGDPHNHGQTFTTLLGNMLRIDVDNGTPYAIPASNPFVNDDSARNEIWATGVRNPWRFSFDKQTGDLFISDVGQNNWEEVNLQPASSAGGENYGWNFFEGTNCYNNACTTDLELTPPIFEYNHSLGCSITGGYIYRGEQFPTLWGNYFVTDYCTGRVWAVTAQEDGSWASEIVLETGRLVASFGEDFHGELYMLDHRNGEILQIQP